MNLSGLGIESLVAEDEVQAMRVDNNASCLQSEMSIAAMPVQFSMSSY